MAGNGRGQPSSRSRTKSKHRRPPQRGLGVAELEKIRLEAQHKISNAPTTAASSPPPPSPPQSLPFNPNPLMFSPSPAPFSASGPPGHFADFPMPWVDQRFRCRPNPEVNSRMVMEPPSNQIYYHNYTAMPSSSSFSSSWPEEDGNLVYMVGMKRPCGVCPNLSFQPYKIPTSTASFVKMNNHSPLGYGDVVSRDPEQSPISYQADLELKHAECLVDQSKKENFGACTHMDDGFLTLGSSLTPSSMRSNHPICVLSPENLASLSYKANAVDNNTSGPNTSSSHCHTFFPSRTEIQEDTAPGSFEETEDLDLSLKL